MYDPQEFPGTDRFRVVRRLGFGGLGVVYEAHDAVRGQRVALKTLRAADSQSVYLLKREFRALADIAHPNLIHLYDLVIEGDLCFFTRVVETVAYMSPEQTRAEPDVTSASDWYCVGVLSSTTRSPDACRTPGARVR